MRVVSDLSWTTPRTGPLQGLICRHRGRIQLRQRDRAVLLVRLVKGRQEDDVSVAGELLSVAAHDASGPVRR